MCIDDIGSKGSGPAEQRKELPEEQSRYECVPERLLAERREDPPSGQRLLPVRPCIVESALRVVLVLDMSSCSGVPVMRGQDREFDARLALLHSDHLVPDESWNRVGRVSREGRGDHQHAPQRRARTGALRGGFCPVAHRPPLTMRVSCGSRLPCGSGPGSRLTSHHISSICRPSSRRIGLVRSPVVHRTQHLSPGAARGAMGSQ